MSDTQPDIKYAPLERNGLNLDIAAMILDNLLADGKAKADSPLFGCEEWLENIFHFLFLDSISRIPDGNAYRLAVTDADLRRPENQGPARLHCLHGVECDIQNYLNQLFRVNIDEG